MTTITLHFWCQQKFSSLLIENVDLDSNIDHLRKMASEKLGPRSYDFIYRGLLLTDKDKSLNDYGIKNGSLINVLEKTLGEGKANLQPLAESEVEKLATLFQNMTSVSNYRTAFMRFPKSELFNQMLEAVPEIKNDSIAMAILKDSELLMNLIEEDSVNTLNKTHPAVLYAVKFIVNHLKEEDYIPTPTSRPTTSSGFSYGLDVMSDEDDMDSNSDTNREPHPLTRNTSYNAITAAQLAAAIASATNTAFNTNSAGYPTSSNVITNEMFSSAMQQAIALSPVGTSTATAPQAAGNNDESLNTITQRLSPQLQQMREMGFTNDGVNMRALQATNGDVQAAIELVFNGVID